MEKSQKIFLTIVIFLVIGILSYQAYSIYLIQESVADLRITQTTQEINIESLKQNVQQVEQQRLSDLAIITSQFKASSSELSELRKDVSNIQVKSQDFTGIIEEVIKSVVSVITDVSQGSGAIIRSDGYIVTNYHVIKDARRIRILTSEEKVYTASVIGISRSKDIALLKIDETNLDFLTLGDSDDVEPGQRVIAVGNPAGLDFTVTEGIVSAINREDSAGNEYIQIDVPINPGNSGGPLISIKKEIIGINNFKIGGFEALGFALESNTVEEVVDEIFNQLEA